MPLIGIALGQAISDHNNQLITLSETTFSLNEETGLEKVHKLIILSN